jgi:D-alanyl-D-alanine carboxypeptidase
MSASGRAMDPQLCQALQRQLDRWQKFAPCLGSNVTVIDGRHGVWSSAAGWRDAEADAPMLAGARFYIFSITKTFVAARLLQLGIKLDSPITAYLTQLPLPDGVTIRRLLNHTAGVPSYTDLAVNAPATCQSPGQPWRPGEVIQRCCGGQLDFQPGEAWHYSNTGYMLLAQAIEAVSGKTLSATIAEGILTPLGLNRTYIADAVDNGLVTPGYSRQLSADEAMINVDPIYHPGWCFTGLMVSTTDEAARFLEALLSGRLLDPPQLAEMLTPVWTGGAAGPFYRRPSYGLGLMIDPDFGHGGLFGHGGEGPGANSWAMYLPDFHGRQLTLAAFCNTAMGGHPFYLVKDLLRVLASA